MCYCDRQAKGGNRETAGRRNINMRVGVIGCGNVGYSTIYGFRNLRC
jgi:hypothetical protein